MKKAIAVWVLAAASIFAARPAAAGPASRVLRLLSESCVPGSRDAVSELLQTTGAASAQVTGEQRLERALTTLTRHDTNALQTPAAGALLRTVDPGLVTDPAVRELLTAGKAGGFDVSQFLENEVHRSALLEASSYSPPPGVPIDPIFDRDVPVFLEALDGRRLPITLSFDTELPVSEAFRLLLDDPSLFRTWDATVSRQTLEATGASIESFLLHPGEAVPEQLHISQLRIPEAWTEAPPAVAAARLGSQGFPVSAEWDGPEILEIAHESFETVPSRFRTIVTRIHNEMESPQTHLHLGLPAEVISAEEATAIARAVETRAVLGIASRPPVPEVIPAGSQGGVLYPSQYMGPVRLELDRWAGTHDLEIRQWDLREGDYHTHGLNLIGFAMKLAREHERLVRYAENFGVPETRIGNLEGALRYAARVLQKNHPEVAQRLVNQAGRIQGIDEVDMEARAAIREMLNADDVLGLLDVNAFLKQPVVR